eukprot:scaffold85680_cov18-Tisochrysis_lutea.AAC.1
MPFWSSNPEDSTSASSQNAVALDTGLSPPSTIMSGGGTSCLASCITCLGNASDTHGDWHSPVRVLSKNCTICAVSEVLCVLSKNYTIYAVSEVLCVRKEEKRENNCFEGRQQVFFVRNHARARWSETATSHITPPIKHHIKNCCCTNLQENCCV